MFNIYVLCKVNLAEEAPEMTLDFTSRQVIGIVP